MTNREAALQYARNGWPVIPLWPINPAGECACPKGKECGVKPGKHPRLNAWQTIAIDLAQVEEWWGDWPDSGVAIRLDYLTVLDVDTHDPDKNGFVSLEAIQQKYGAVLDSRVKQRTGGGGEHQLFKAVEDLKTAKGFAPGLDLLCDSGHYILVEPTTHDSGNRYCWLDAANPLTTPRAELALEEPPQWLLRAVTEPKPTKAQVIIAKARAGRKPLDTILAEALERIRPKADGTPGEDRHVVTASWMGIAKAVGYDKLEVSPRVTGWLDSVNELVVGKTRKFTKKECEEALRWIFSRPAKDEGAEEGGEKSQTDEILDLCSDFEYFRSGPADDGYVRLMVDDHREVHLAGTSKGPDPKLRQILTQRFLEKKNRAPAREALNGAADTVLAKCGAGPKVDTFVRFCRSNDVIYLDLADDQWRAVKITRDGWEVISNPPVLFRRGAGAKPLPEPVRGGTLDSLRPLVNAGDDAQWCLILSWLVGCFLPTGAFTVLTVNGEQGSAKSTACVLLLAVVDPSTAGLCGAPKDETDAIVSALHSGILAFDNLKTLRSGMSDVLCRFSTGSGYRTRTFYENKGVTVIDVRLPLLLNGIDITIMQPDLLERSIKLWLPHIAAADRTTIAKVEAQFEVIHPGVLGALLTAVATGLRNLPTTVLADAPRMSDFCTWIVACESSLPWEPGAFLKAFRDKQANAVADLAENDDVAPALLEWAEKETTPGSTVQINAKDLLIRLNDLTIGVPKNMQFWPSSPAVLAHYLTTHGPMLRERGIDVQRLPRDGRSRTRFQIHIDGPQPKLALLFERDRIKDAA